MINWHKPSHCAVPTHYPCLMLFDDGTCIAGTYTFGMRVIAWTVINKPPWAERGSGKATGERHPKTKLSDEDCELIRDAYATGCFTYQQLAEKFDSSKSTIRDIIKFRSRIYESVRA